MARGADGTLLVLGAAAFFVGSGLLTQVGEPGASTPRPWLVSHALWAVATALVAAGSLRTLRALPLPDRGLVGDLAVGGFGLAVLHSLGWLAWTYADVLAARSGEHDLLHPSLLHPFGTAHALVYAVVLGCAVAALAWRLVESELHRLLGRAGVALGVASALAACGSLVVALDVPHPLVVGTVLLTGALHGWLGLLGATLYRSG